MAPISSIYHMRVVLLTTAVLGLTTLTGSSQLVPAPASQPAARESVYERARVGINPSASDRSRAGSLPTAPDAKSPVPGRDLLLADLGVLLGGSAKPLEVHLCFGGSEQLSETAVAQGAAIVQALALRAGYRPIIASHGSKLQPGKFNVLVGLPQTLRGYIPDAELQRVQRGYLGLSRNRGRSDTPVLTISGRTPDDITSAVISLGLVQEKLPAAPFAVIREVILPDAPPFYRRDPVQIETAYTFEKLQEAGAGISTPLTAGLAIEFFYPGNLPTDSDAEVTLDLHYSQRRRALTDDTLVVRLNGQDVGQKRSAAKPSGNGGSEMSVTFPLRRLVAGHNILEITRGGNPGLATDADRGDLRIYADSTLSLPKVEGGTRLPDLSITGRTFYPFVGQPDGSDFAVVLTDQSAATIDSAWMLLGRLAQSANTFFYSAQITFGIPTSNKHRLVIGPYDRLSAEYRRLASPEIFRAEHAHIPVSELDKVYTGTNLKQLIERWMGGDKKSAAVADSEAKEAEAYAVIGTGPVPGQEGSWALVLTAASSDLLVERTRSLVQADFWDRLCGDTVRWGREPGSFQAHVPGEVFAAPIAVQTVEFPFGERMDLRLWIGLASGCLVFFVLLSAWVLGKFDQAVVLRQRRPQ